MAARKPKVPPELARLRALPPATRVNAIVEMHRAVMAQQQVVMAEWAVMMLEYVKPPKLKVERRGTKAMHARGEGLVVVTATRRAKPKRR
jgi:hypothetical protein